MLLCPYNEIYIYIENRYMQHRCSARERKRFVDCAVFKWYRGHILSALTHTKQMTTDHLFWQPHNNTPYNFINLIDQSVCVSVFNLLVYCIIDWLEKKKLKSLFCIFDDLKEKQHNIFSLWICMLGCHVFFFKQKTKLPLLLLRLLYDWNENCSQFNFDKTPKEILTYPIRFSFEIHCNRVSSYLIKDWRMAC